MIGTSSKLISLTLWPLLHDLLSPTGYFKLNALRLSDLGVNDLKTDTAQSTIKKRKKCSEVWLEPCFNKY